MPNLNVLSQLPEGKASTVGCSLDLRRIIQTWGEQGGASDQGFKDVLRKFHEFNYRANARVHFRADSHYLNLVLPESYWVIQSISHRLPIVYTLLHFCEMFRGEVNHA